VPFLLSETGASTGPAGVLSRADYSAAKISEFKAKSGDIAVAMASIFNEEI